jgi:D-glycero-alpha-D-manno-heptose-7-phosphate kinase
MKMLKIDDPMEIIYASDVPSKLGLGTSSAMAAAMLKALMYFKGWGVSTEMLVDYTYKLEREILNEVGGFQDQFAVCFGGFNYLEGRPNNVKRTSVALQPIQAQNLMDHMLLVYTGNNGQSSDILQDQLALLKCGETLDDTLHIKTMVQEMYSTLLNPNFSPMDLGYVMREAWELKKKLSKSMAGPRVKKIEDTVLGINSKAGLRLVGGGGDRGMVLILTQPEFMDEIKKELAPLKTSKVEFEYEGVTVRRMFHGGYNEDTM